MWKRECALPKYLSTSTRKVDNTALSTTSCSLNAWLAYCFFGVNLTYSCSASPA